MLVAAARRWFSQAPKKAFHPKDFDRVSPFPGANSPWVNEVTFVKGYDPMPVYHVLGFDGDVVNPKWKNQWTKEECIEAYSTMVLVNELDQILYKAQRHGQISFYMTNFCEEAAQVGSSKALLPEDHLYVQYRETGVLLHRGFQLETLMNQNFSTEDDLGKGRQMPVHYQDKNINFQTISSPLGTQIPQAAGAAYALKHAGEKAVVACYFGEGAASEGDFHAGMNFASTLKCPVLFFCRNNGYAISTPTTDQYAGDGIASRGLGYGMHSIRVDGNDLFAVYEVTKAARELAISEGVPVLIEAMTYRGGHHSTSDDSSRYRSVEEIQRWLDTPLNPINRMRAYMEKQGFWDEEQEKGLRKQYFDRILEEMDKAEVKGKTPVSELFRDVYGSEELPVVLQRQEESLKRHLQKYPEEYRS